MAQATASALGRRGMVATAFPAATEAGVAMLRAGGNAVDAAVAAAWALAVCEPSGSGLGGQAVALVRLAQGSVLVVDGHARAPAAVSRATVGKAEQRRGYRACTVPTMPATLGYLLRRFGTLSQARVLEPALTLAEGGYAITPLQHRQLGWCKEALRSTAAAGAVFLHDGEPYRVGETFRQPRLAAALRRIAIHGVEDFYEGEIAQAIVADMRRNHGLLDAADLAAVEDPVEREPIALRHRGHEILTIPPPGGGVELLAALELLEDMHRAGAGGRFVQIAEATYGAFVLRERRHGAKRPGCAPSFAGAATEEPGETTHLCAADEAGNVVSLTQSIQSLFGAKVANDRYGFLYNNYLCTLPRRRHPYRLRGGCAARSNAAPLLVRGPAGEPRLTAGAAGSRRIVSSLLQVLDGVLGDHHLSLGESLSAPRVHARLSRRVWIERPAATEALEAALAQHGFKAEPRGEHAYGMGAVQAIRLHPDGRLEGAADPRRDGSAEGL